MYCSTRKSWSTCLKGEELQLHQGMRGGCTLDSSASNNMLTLTTATYSVSRWYLQPDGVVAPTTRAAVGRTQR